MNKHLKVVASALTAMLVAGSLAGCGSTSAADKKVTVNIFQFKVEAKAALEKATKEYMKDHKNVTIKVETVGGGADYGAALKAKFASGQEPAIYNIGGPQDVKDWTGKLEDLTKEPWVSKAFDGTLGAVTKDGKIYGMPFDLEGYGLIYNKTIFQKAGIDGSTIKTYADLEAAVKTLDSKKKDLKLDAVFAFPAKETWVTGLHLSNIAFSNEFKDGTEAFNAKTLGFTQSEGLKKLLDIQVNYGVKPDGTNKSVNSVDYSTQVEKEFSTGKVAMIQQGNWAFGTINGIDPELAKNVGFVPMSLDGVKEGCLPVGVPMYWAVNSKKDDATKKAAKDFINWLYTSDKGKEMIINDFKFIPAFKGYDSDKLQPSDPLSKQIMQASKDGKTMPWVFMGYPTGWGQDKLGTDIQKYISGDLTWDKLVQNAKDNWAAARK